MSDGEEKNDKRPGEEEVPPTVGFGDSVVRPGGQIGPFRIERELGRGGAGVVYLGHDTKLDRPVAIKSLPDELMGNPRARLRFAREARVLASLNHPNISMIYEELEEAEGTVYLVLEYVPGDTLAERVRREQLKVEEALTIGLQIAEAVAAAHEHGVIHRDLKAGNIKITPEGKVKVLDFGLAKAVGDETLMQQSTITQPGQVMGTPAYMSPEQARGEAADERSDIWSFGCVLYEILTGKAPFKSDTISGTLACILEHTPNWEMLPETTPANIQVLVRRCLEKDPRRRLRDIGDAVIEISETLRLPSTTVTVPTPPSVSFKPSIAGKRKLRRIVMIICGTIIIGLCGVGIWLIPRMQTPPPSKEKVLVVLPFENLGSAEDEYFAAGITDAITARLAGIGGLGVISRQSAMQYKGRNKSARVIGEELGVDYILEGTVQRERPSDFQVQSDLAERVAQALDITLFEPERQALRSRPTENMEAYDYYLRGNEYYHRSTLESDVSIAMRMYEKAVELDPTFALAYAVLARAHLDMYWFYYDRSEERLLKAKEAVDKALQLNPDLPEVRLALGMYYYHGHLDYARALEQFGIARKSQPNNSGLLACIGYVQRRQGKFEQALATFKRACELDPLSGHLTNELGETFMLLRKYPEAKRYFERTISLCPDVPIAYTWKTRLCLLWEGSTEKAGAVLDEASQNIGSLKEHSLLLQWVLLAIFDGNYEEALDRLSVGSSEFFETQFYFIPKAQLYAQVNGLMGNRQLEQEYYESARSILETKMQERPRNARLHSSLGITYGGLGRKEDALREGKLAVELLPVSKEAWGGIYRVEDLARIYVMIGEFDAAIDQIEFLLSVPGEMSIPLLRLDLAWAPLRDHRRFKKLLEGGK
jgi:serine/threonine protein kinase/Tfp pilus assembly protein PilF